MKLTPPKGTSDLWNEKFYAYQWISDSILKTLELYGFRQLRTPGFESIDILAKDAGSEITNQIYLFQDKAGRDFGIKSDITPAVARFVAKNGPAIPKPIKIACADRIYRYERPQSGRNREITQVNAELFGVKPAQIEGELLACFYDCYKKLGMPKTKIQIGFRPLLERFCQNIVKTKKETLKLIRLIDKKDKLSEKDFLSELKAIKISSSNIKKILSFISLKGPVLKTLEKARKFLSKQAELQGYLADLNKISKFLELYEVTDKCQLNLGLARGFEYYTGIIFEANLPGSSFGSIGGGGRYDNLVAQYGGKDTPAIGFSIGIDRVYLVLQELGMPDKSPEISSYLVTKNRSEDLPEAIKLAQKLRSENKIVELDILGKNYSDQMKAAKKINPQKIIKVSHHEKSVAEVDPNM